MPFFTPPGKGQLRGTRSSINRRSGRRKERRKSEDDKDVRGDGDGCAKKDNYDEDEGKGRGERATKRGGQGERIRGESYRDR